MEEGCSNFLVEIQSPFRNSYPEKFGLGNPAKHRCAGVLFKLQINTWMEKMQGLP